MHEKLHLARNILHAKNFFGVCKLSCTKLHIPRSNILHAETCLGFRARNFKHPARTHFAHQKLVGVCKLSFTKLQTFLARTFCTPKTCLSFANFRARLTFRRAHILHTKNLFEFVSLQTFVHETSNIPARNILHAENFCFEFANFRARNFIPRANILHAENFFLSMQTFVHETSSRAQTFCTPKTFLGLQTFVHENSHLARPKKLLVFFCKAVIHSCEQAKKCATLCS